MDKTGLRHDIERAINANSAENGSNTPDFILAEFLTNCLSVFEKAIEQREAWYGVKMEPGGNNGRPPSDPPSTSSAR